MHDEIKRFALTGEVDSGTFVSARDALIQEVEATMRDEGYVPVVDLIPQFTRMFKPETGTFDFELSVYGAFVGEDKAWEVRAWTNGTLIERSTHPQR